MWYDVCVYAAAAAEEYIYGGMKRDRRVVGGRMMEYKEQKKVEPTRIAN